MVLAHPLTEPGELGVAPAFVALLATVVVLGGGRVLSLAPLGRGPERAGVQAAASDPSRPAVAVARDVLGRVLGVVALVLAVGAARFGSDAQFDNLAPPLVLGVGWPLLLLANAAVPGAWDWVNPFDTLARGLRRLQGGDAPTRTSPHLEWVAVAGAAGIGWWLAVYVPGRDPRPLGALLGLYTVLTLAGCLAVGRQAWLGRAEVLTVLSRAISAARRGAAATMDQRHLVAMAVLMGGLSFAEVRFSRWFVTEVGRLGVLPFSAPPAIAGFVLLVGVAVWSVRATARTNPVAVQHAVPWLVVGVGLATALERDRLWSSSQLVYARLSDPLGLGWDLFGTAERQVVSWPWDDVGRLVAQVVVLGVPALVGTAIALRRGRGPASPVTWLVFGWVLFSALSIASH